MALVLESTTDIDRARFWATFDECATKAVASENQDQADAFMALKQCHTRCRGLTDDMIQNKVACIMQVNERFWLAQFVTDSKYFSFDTITVLGFAEWDHKRLPKAMTCSSTLPIAFYDSDEDMQFKLSAASMHLGYGFS